MKGRSRIDKIPAYIFSRIDEVKNKLISEGVDVIDLGIGDPDLETPKFILNELIENVGKEGTHKYSPYSGIDGFKKAVAYYYLKEFGVELNHEKEVAMLIGSKEGIVNLILALTDYGDTVIMPNPGYPVYNSAITFSGCRAYGLTLVPENNYLPDIKSIPSEELERSKLLILNYPNNPTGAVANIEFYNELIENCIKFNLPLLNDGAYLDICKKEKRISLLQGKDAKKICVETGSFSKSYNMAGFRLGYMVGNSDIIKKLMIMKTNVDSAQYIPIQRAGICALNQGLEFIKELNSIYEWRRKILSDFFISKGISVFPSEGAFYLWFKIPKGYSSIEFCEFVLKNSGIIITPGNAFGSMGEGYGRISLTNSNDMLLKSIRRLNEIF